MKKDSILEENNKRNIRRTCESLYYYMRNTQGTVVISNEVK